MNTEKAEIKIKIEEGYMPFRGYKTYYRIAGADKMGQKGIIPILMLHGGPGSTHNYFEVFDEMGEDRPIITYDQIGCGRSGAYDRADLFNMDIWMEELQAIRDYLKLEELVILGQSWGGMLLLQYMVDKAPEGVKGIVLASTLPASWMWGKAQHRMIKELPTDMQLAIDKADETGKYDTPECIRATDEYMLRHCAPDWKNDPRECLYREKPEGSGELAYMTGWGPNEFTPLGNLKDYDVIDKLDRINCPALITSGTSDLCTPYIAKSMADRIPGAKWILYAESRHMSFAEETDKYITNLSDWMMTIS